MIAPSPNPKSVNLAQYRQRVGSFLRQLRTACGLTAKQVALLSGFHESMIYKVEYGQCAAPEQLLEMYVNLHLPAEANA